MQHLGHDEKMNDLNLSGVVPVDDDYHRYRRIEINDDCNSAFSVASSQYNFSWENGRLYHDYRSGHVFPYDAMSNENERIFHAMMLYILDDKYYVAPIKGSSLRNVLDLGTGLGLWAENMAERYPEAKVVGLDTAPHRGTVLPNCSFIPCDISDEWVLDDPSVKFDLIHIRSLFACLNDSTWPVLYSQCYDNLASGGWIEQIEIEIDPRCDDNTAQPGSQIIRLAKLSDDLTRSTGREWNISRNMKQMIEDAGFVNVQESRQKLPLGPWSTDKKFREVGKFYERFYRTGLQGWLLHTFTTLMGYTVEQVNDECMKALREIDERKQHYYFSVLIVIGKKP